MVMWLQAALAHMCCSPAEYALPWEVESTSELGPGMPPARGTGAAGRPWEMSPFIVFPVHIDPQQAEVPNGD